MASEDGRWIYEYQYMPKDSAQATYMNLYAVSISKLPINALARGDSRRCIFDPIDTVQAQNQLVSTGYARFGKSFRTWADKVNSDLTSVAAQAEVRFDQQQADCFGR